MEFQSNAAGFQGTAHALPWIDSYHSASYLYPGRYKQKDIYNLKNSYITTPGSYSGAVSGLSGIADLMDQKREVIEARARLVLEDIAKRKTIREQNLEKIALDQCTCRNLIYEMGEAHMLYMDKRRIDLEKQILDLEKEKRMEESSYFRDILFLRKELREAFIEGMEEYQKASLFMNQPEETPCKI